VEPGCRCATRRDSTTQATFARSVVAIGGADNHLIVVQRTGPLIVQQQGECMPADYECTNCNLGFSVGTYHYHAHENGYFGRTLLVCGSCGAQHSLEIPLGDSTVLFALESQPNVLTVSKVRGSKLRVPFADWSRRAYVLNSDTHNLRCQLCTAVGTLISEWPAQGAQCPRCTATIKDCFCHWLT